MNTFYRTTAEELNLGHDLILVTIVSRTGSSPCGNGAQMLVGENGRICGTIGGGAVEHQCEAAALRLLREKRSDRQNFVLRGGSPDDIGMVCGGEVSVWFQFLDSSLTEIGEVFRKAADLLDAHEEGWLVIRKNRDLPGLGLLDADGSPAAGCCETAAVPDGEALTETDDAFFLRLAARERAVLFGGGHCAQALVPFLNRTGFRVTVMECREEYAKKDLFPEAEEILCGDYRNIRDSIALTHNDYVIIMTNGHTYDLEIELQVLREPPVYVGVIGSRAKIAVSRQKLLAVGIPEAVLDSVHTPIGLPIKAVTPEEIAVSITAEMILERARLREEKCGQQKQKCPMH